MVLGIRLTSPADNLRAFRRLAGLQTKALASRINQLIELGVLVFSPEVPLLVIGICAIPDSGILGRADTEASRPDGIIPECEVAGLGCCWCSSSKGDKARRKTLLDSGVGPVTVAKAYRLLKAILNTAVDDELIRRHPCLIKGAGQEKSPERPVLSLRQVFDLADAFTDRRFRLLILLAVFCGLR